MGSVMMGLIVEKNGRRTWKRKVEKNIAQLAVREMQAGNDVDLTLRFSGNLTLVIETPPSMFIYK